MLRRGWVAAAVVSACGPVPKPPPPVPTAPRIAIVAAERSGAALRLVSIDEHGDRQLELVAPSATPARDTSPAVSPDGRWLVFASSRGRPIDETRLWIAALGAGANPRPLTTGDVDGRGKPILDAHPVWTPDGRAVVFASTRDAGNYDLWRLELANGVAGALTQLTHGAGHEVTPTIGPDGAIVYTSVIADEATKQVATHLEQRGPDGTIRALTDGPADSSPAVSPDGRWLVFSRPVLRDGKIDAELWRMPRAGGTAQPLIDLPLTDETGAVWSRDSRFVFATSVVRGADGHALFSSIIHVDLQAKAPIVRMLEDRVGAIVRLTPAMTAVPLDAAALDGDPVYLPELARAMSQLIEQARARPAD